MTPRQYARWKDFALRMAAHGWQNLTPARQERLRAYVTEWFECLDDSGEWQAIKCWDHNVYVWLTPSWGGERLLKPCKAMLVCDHYVEWMERLPGYWHMPDRRLDDFSWKFATQIACCLRAGLDMAGSPSTGVLGFTVGDLRRMYAGTIPAWIVSGFQSEDGLPVDLNALADAAHVWL